MYLVSAICIVGVLGYYAFLMLESTGLSTTSGETTLGSKEYRAAGSSFHSQPVGNQRITRVSEIPEAFLLKFEIEGQQLEFPVDKSLYDSLEEGDALRVQYAKRRLSGTIAVSNVTRGG